MKTVFSEMFKLKNAHVVTLLLLVIPSLGFAIDSPLSPRGNEVAQSMVKWEWDWVPGAQQYEVTVDGAVQGLTRDPQFFSRNLWAGEHSMTVKALTGDWQYSGRSATTKINVNGSYDPANPARSYLVGGGGGSGGGTGGDSGGGGTGGDVSIPQNVRGWEAGPGRLHWEWDAVTNAATYELVIDGGNTVSTADNKYVGGNLWVGDHSITVKAVAQNGQRSEATRTLKLRVNTAPDGRDDGNEGGGGGVQPPPPPPNDTGLIDPASWGYNEIYQKSNYDLVFSDEFNAGSLNPNRWNTQLRWDGEFNGERYEYRVINGEKQFYVNPFTNDQGHKDTVVPRYNPFEFNGSRLAIRAIRNPLKLWSGNADHGPLYNIVSQQDFLSGAISTYDKFTQKYGIFEARIKIPSHIGTFPAFWLHHQKQRWEGTKRTEIDIMENLGHAPWYVYNSFHYYDNVSGSYGGDDRSVKPSPSGQIYTGTDYSQDYHVYAVEWQPGYVKWMIDGQTVSELWNSNVDNEDLYIIMNMAMGGNWTNFPANIGGLGRNSGDYFPTQNDLNNFGNPALEIDWVRVYRRK